MTEKNIQSLIHIAVSKEGSTIFRNNTGMAWQGEVIRKKDYIVIKNPRPIHAGLCPGSSDLIGWTPLTITADMVGKTVAVFTSIEVKSQRGRTSEEQKNFIAKVRESGGIAGIARSEKEALDLIGK